jgi:hypothetical protein
VHGGVRVRAIGNPAGSRSHARARRHPPLVWFAPSTGADRTVAAQAGRSRAIIPASLRHVSGPAALPPRLAPDFVSRLTSSRADAVSRPTSAPLASVAALRPRIAPDPVSRPPAPLATVAALRPRSRSGARLPPGQSAPARRSRSRRIARACAIRTIVGSVSRVSWSQVMRRTWMPRLARSPSRRRSFCWLRQEPW